MNDEQQARQGVLFALAAYLMWGIAPVYFKMLEHINPVEIICHRILWSFLLLAVLLHFGKQWPMIRNLLSDRRKIYYLIATSVLIGGNWLIFIWAINNHHLLDASLGYYINPLLNVILGMVFLNERLRILQWVAVALATIGVVIQLILFGSIPIIAIALASTFGIYGLLRKKVMVSALNGLFIETLILVPVALIYLLGFANSATSNLTENSFHLNGLLAMAGVVTTLPLLCFAGAATRMKLSTLGFFQYIGPSMMFILATVFYGEPFSPDKATTFLFIWGALILFSYDGIRSHHRKRPVVVIEE
ncbi:EamA family transporter RarD [Vibrio spartinae]|uniref:Chloramphenical resistance permease RarD n=1 Tax=Vibrio spartinae TaxID=1918945 RepID=A0A1N6M346_9VIBR|nr:EamA family transporter RarD [Vibrio spartinae]QMV12900.1 putative chloramphenical resistance permease RarD [Vibrio spartinae]SIO93776.1 EamA-like transporter family protein [Vibrio spartinae]